MSCCHQGGLAVLPAVKVLDQICCTCTLLCDGVQAPCTVAACTGDPTCTDVASIVLPAVMILDQINSTRSRLEGLQIQHGMKQEGWL